MKVYTSQEDLQKQKEYLQSQCRKAGLTIATQRAELLALKKNNINLHQTSVLRIYEDRCSNYRCRV